MELFGQTTHENTHFQKDDWAMVKGTTTAGSSKDGDNSNDGSGVNGGDRGGSG